MYYKVLIQESNDPILKMLYDKKIKARTLKKSITDTTVGISRIRTEFHGFIVSDKSCTI